jgi:hypothetical protein
MRHHLAAIPVCAAFISVACGSPSTKSASANLTQATNAQIMASLSFLNSATSIVTVDPSSSSGTQDIALLNAAIAADPDTSNWIANAGNEASPHILSVGFADGTSAILASREWLNGDPSSPSSRSSIVYVDPPSGTPFGYAEQHVYQSGNVDVASFWTLDGQGGGFQAAGGYTFNPANAEQQNVDSNAGNVPITQVDGGGGGGNEGGSESADAGGGDSGASEDASESADGGSDDSDGGIMVGSRRELGLLSNGTTDSCALCADGLLAAKLIGIGAAYATGTGAATAVCALVGIPTAEAGGVACHLVVVAVSTAALLPWDFNSRASDCNYVSSTVLGMNPVCANAPSPATPPIMSSTSK